MRRRESCCLSVVRSLSSLRRALQCQGPNLPLIAVLPWSLAVLATCSGSLLLRSTPSNYPGCKFDSATLAKICLQVRCRLCMQAPRLSQVLGSGRASWDPLTGQCPDWDTLGRRGLRAKQAGARRSCGRQHSTCNGPPGGGICLAATRSPAAGQPAYKLCLELAEVSEHGRQLKGPA